MSGLPYFTAVERYPQALWTFVQHNAFAFPRHHAKTRYVRDFSGGSSKATPHMPRLTDTDYLARHRYLRLMWQECPYAFAVLKPREQRQLHRYYQTQAVTTDAALIANRQRLTADSPALPHVASKAFHHLYDCFRAADVVAGDDDRAFRRALAYLAQRQATGGRRLTATARPEPDLRVLARALLELGSDSAA